MTKRIKAILAAAGVAVAGVMVLSIYFGALGVVFPPKPDHTQWPGQVVIELMPATSPEYLERHFPGPDGKDLRTEIDYRNGDRGVKVFRKDNTLDDWTITFSAGDARLHVVYAKDGKQVVFGYEFRADRTLKWQASNQNGVASVRTFYYDGTTVFSVVDRKIGNDVQDARYFRKDGKPWLHQVGSLVAGSNPQLEEVWDKDGNELYKRTATSTDGKTVDVTYFRPDGTAQFTQHWVTVTYSGYGGYGGYEDYYPSSNTVIKAIDEFEADGKTVTRRIVSSDDGSAVESLSVFSADGTSVLYTVKDKEIAHVLKKDKDGSVVQDSDVKPGSVKYEIADELKKALPTAPKPADYWKSLETDESKRGEDAP
jgi:hypothetical protein